GKNFGFVYQVKNSFIYSQKVAPISVCVSNRELPDGASLTITGWGHTQYHGNYSDQLQATILRKGPTNECNITYAGRITDKMICVYQATADIPQGTCQGDSGGPLTYAGILVGVVSFAKGCAYKNYPTVYTKVSAFHHWIETKLADHKRSLFKNLAIPMRICSVIQLRKWETFVKTPVFPSRAQPKPQDTTPTRTLLDTKGPPESP
ncbi:unnamed protein product, partial [Timema podura]|nr:unnamed protein product [Timema podura]